MSSQSPHQLERNAEPIGYRLPMVSFIFFLADKSKLYLLGKGQEKKVTVHSLKGSHFPHSGGGRHHQQYGPESECSLSSCHLFIIWYHIIQSFKGDRGGLRWAAGGRNGWCVWTAGATALAGVLFSVILCRRGSAPRLATERTSSLLTHKVIRWWGKLRIPFSPQIWLPLRPVPKGKV